MTAQDIIGKIENVARKNRKEGFIQLHEPYFVDTNSLSYVQECIETGWVSSTGKWVERFEQKIAEYTGAKYAIAVTNGTVGLRLAMHICGVRQGDEVLMPAMTFVATANAAAHLGAIPHFVDIEKESLGIDPKKLNEYLNRIGKIENSELVNKRTGNRIKGIVPVHIFGNPCKINELNELANKWKLVVVEDAAEALGSYCKEKHCGLFGKVGVLSFNGNKIITTGGGGMLITNNKEVAMKAKHLSTTAKVNNNWELLHDEIAWNDRMPNINAALGAAQLEKIEERIQAKSKLKESYEKILEKNKYVKIKKTRGGDRPNNWLIALRIEGDLNSDINKLRNDLLKLSQERGLMMRPIWKPLNQLNMYMDNPKDNLEQTENEIYRLINIPSSPQLF